MTQKEKQELRKQRQEQLEQRRRARLAKTRETLLTTLHTYGCTKKPSDLATYGPIRDFEGDLAAFLETNQEISLHAITPTHKLRNWSQLFPYFYPFPVDKEPSVYNVIMKGFQHYLPPKKFGSVVVIQAIFGTIAKIWKDDLPPFFMICSTEKNPTVRNLVKTEYCEVCMYAEHVVTKKEGKFLGTIVITDVYPLLDYTLEDYETDRDFVDPTVGKISKIFLLATHKRLRRLFNLPSLEEKY